MVTRGKYDGRGVDWFIPGGEDGVVTTMEAVAAVADVGGC